MHKGSTGRSVLSPDEMGSLLTITCVKGEFLIFTAILQFYTVDLMLYLGCSGHVDDNSGGRASWYENLRDLSSYSIMVGCRSSRFQAV